MARQRRVCLGCLHLGVYGLQPDATLAGQPYCKDNGTRLWWDAVFGDEVGGCPRWRCRPWTTGEVRRLQNLRASGAKDWVARACVELLRAPSAIEQMATRVGREGGRAKPRRRLTRGEREKLGRLRTRAMAARRAYRDYRELLGLTAQNARTVTAAGPPRPREHWARHRRIDEQVKRLLSRPGRGL